MERFVNVAFIHLTITAISVLGFGAVREGDSVILKFVLQTCARLITIPGRQIGQILLPDGSGWLWLVYAGNSVVWALVLVGLWSMIDARRKK
jgi:hypothetical protein